MSEQIEVGRIFRAWKVSKDGLLKYEAEYESQEQFIEHNHYKPQEYLDSLIVTPVLISTQKEENS